MGLWLAPLITSLGVSLTIAVMALWRCRRVPTAGPFAVVPLSHAAWTALEILEIRAPTLNAKLLLAGLQWLAGLGALAGSLWFASRYAGKRLRPGVWAVLLIAPLPLIALLVTEPLHHHFHPDAWIRMDALPASLEYGWSWLEVSLVAYGCLLVTMACSLVIRQLTQQHSAYLGQNLVVLAGLAFPPLLAVVSLSLGVRTFNQRDPMPILFGMGDLLVAYGLFRRKLFDMSPVALEVVVRGLADGVLVCDREGRVVDVNPAFFDGLGVVGPAPIGLRAAQVLAPWPPLVAAAAGVRPPEELAVERPDGVRWFDVSSTRLDDGRGNDIGCVVVLRDVSERKRASERRFQALFDHAFELMGLLDPQGILIAANSTALQFAGVQQAQVVGRPLWETPWWAHSETLREELRAAIGAVRSGEVARFETTHVRCDAKSRYFDFSLKAVYDDRGAIEFMIAEGRDMTELRQAERENATLTERLERARRLESVGRLAGGIAHDFNNLLQAISGSIEIARTELGSQSPTDKPLAIAAQAADSASRLTRQLLAFGRRQMGSPRLVEVGPTLAQVEPLLRAMAAPRARLHLHTPPDLWPIRIDPAHLEQVLINLVVNARDATAEGGDLVVQAENVQLVEARTFQGMEAPPGEYLQLTVTDTGSGMSESVLERIFEPFFSTKPLGKGTGLGLSVVYGICQQYSGYLEVSSRPGEGTEIRLFFPRGDEAAVAAAEAVTATGALPRGRERIVVVEDQQAVRGFMRDLLRGLGYEVHAYADGSAAQSAAASLNGPPDLLLADVALPGPSGPEVADLLRGRWPQLKVLLVSGFADDGAPWRASRARAYFLPKPVGAATLARRVRAILDTPEPPPAAE